MKRNLEKWGHTITVEYHQSRSRMLNLGSCAVPNIINDTTDREPLKTASSITPRQAGVGHICCVDSQPMSRTIGNSDLVILSRNEQSLPVD